MVPNSQPFMVPRDTCHSAGPACAASGLGLPSCPQAATSVSAHSARKWVNRRIVAYSLIRRALMPSVFN